MKQELFLFMSVSIFIAWSFEMDGENCSYLVCVMAIITFKHKTIAKMILPLIHHTDLSYIKKPLVLLCL